MSNHPLANEITKHTVEQLNRTLRPPVRLTGTGSKDHEYLALARHSIHDPITNDIYFITVDSQVRLADRNHMTRLIATIDLADPDMLQKLQTALHNHITTKRP